MNDFTPTDRASIRFIGSGLEPLPKLFRICKLEPGCEAAVGFNAIVEWGVRSGGSIFCGT